MTPESMESLIHAKGSNISINHNVVNFQYSDIHIVLIYDENADRMRLVSGICNVSELKEGQLSEAMEANYHSALDARYAIGNEVVWAAFIHPLSELSEELFVSAIDQVACANKNFGTSYQSGNMVFGG